MPGVSKNRKKCNPLTTLELQHRLLELDHMQRRLRKLWDERNALADTVQRLEGNYLAGFAGDGDEARDAVGALDADIKDDAL
jgi:hypothetical protein